MANSRKLLLLSLTFSAAACAADPSLLNLLMPDASMLFGANVERILESPIGKEIGTQIQGAPQLQQILKPTGFDPTHDLKEILVASTGKGRNPPVLVLVRGSFDAAKFRSFAVSSGAQPRDYEGVQILSNLNETYGAIAFLDDTLVAAGDLVQVRAAIHRRTQHTALAPELSSQIATLSDRYDVWGIADVPMTPMASGASNPNLKQLNDLLQSIERVSGGLKFGSSVDLALVLQMRSEKDAGRMQDSLRLLSGFVVASAQNPSGLKPGAVQIGGDAKTIRIAITVSEAELKKAYELRMARNAKKPPVAEDGGLVIQSSEKDMGTLALPPAKKD